MEKKYVTLNVLVVTMSLLVLLVMSADYAAGITTDRVSVSSSGDKGNGHSTKASVSADGRLVAFQSEANNLVQNDTNLVEDIFVRDLLTGTTTRVSVSSNGDQGDNQSIRPSISADGRYVAFDSIATNLIPGGTSGQRHIYVRDRQTGITTRVSVSGIAGIVGTQGNGSSAGSSISADGRFVAFISHANNLVSDDVNGKTDIFVHDRDTDGDSIFDETGAINTTRVSVSSGGGQANGNSGVGIVLSTPSISADGRFVAFISSATNLVVNDTNGFDDIFVHDRQTNTTTRVSISSTGSEGNGHSLHPSISADGRFVTFVSEASNLVLSDTNAKADIYVHDRNTGTTTRVSVSSEGVEGNGNSPSSSISADGRYVAFYSVASNLVPNDSANADIFVHDRNTGTTVRVSVSSSGEPANQQSFDPSISADGQHVAFDSFASNLVSGDINDLLKDVYLATLTKADTTTTVSSSAVTSVFGQSVTFIAAVTSGGSAVVTEGSITFKEGTTILAGPTALNSSGQASFSTSTLSVGSHTITAEYSGSSNFNSSSGFMTQTVNKADTSTTVTSSANVSAVGQPVTFTATVSTVAPGTGIPTGTVQFKDGATNIDGLVSLSSGVASLTTSSLSAGVYSITAEYNGDSNFNGSSGQLDQFVVIYDPDGGFVTGGGWINSPAGAYTADPSATGKANFGFVSKYLPGAKTPSGNTEFQFKAGNLNFKSTSYEWLVVAGAKAQYKGDGTVNGSGSYSFKLTAIDGQINGGGDVDKFRIKIWGSGGVIYDNQLGADDSEDPTTVLGGGSIQIHKSNAAPSLATLLPNQLPAPLLPKVTSLGAAFPNPFNPETWIPFNLAKDVKVTIRIYNASGNLIRSLDLGQKQAGFYTTKDRAAYWDGRNESGESVSSGIYFYAIQAGEYAATRKMLLLK